jgi:Xaa-Pro dipeptidase
MKKENIDLTYIDNPQTVAYFTHFESNPHERIVALFALQDTDFLFTPALEKEEAFAVSAVKDIVSYNDGENPWAVIAEEIKKRISTPNLIGIEENTLTVERYNELSTLSSNVQFFHLQSYLQNAQLTKTDEEIERMKKAGQIADEAIQIGINALKEGITEQEVVAEIEYELKKKGISEMSFPTMVLFGDHAGSPHGNPGERQLKKGELVLFDLGVVSEGYTSDVTRTIAFGDVPSDISDIYQIVLQAQQQAQAAVKPGITAEQLDAIARDVIAEAGYGQYFTHRLGHGLGKSVHEFPSLAQGNDLIIKEGMCFSIEPGIYIPGKIGVRIEDCVYVTETGCEPFTHTTKELQFIR